MSPHTMSIFIKESLKNASVNRIRILQEHNRKADMISRFSKRGSKNLKIKADE
jgi:hypothetical protein